MKKLLIALLVLVSVSAGAQVKETIVRMDSASSLFKEKYYPKQLIRISTDSTLLALTHATQIGQSMQTVLDSLWYKVIGTPSSVSDSTFAYAVTELTINGVTQNLKHDRTWTIASTDSGSFQKSDSNTVRNAITLTYLNSQLVLKRNLNNHDSLSTLDEKSYNSLTDKPTIATFFPGLQDSLSDRYRRKDTANVLLSRTRASHDYQAKGTYLTAESDPYYRADTANIAFLNQENTFTKPNIFNDSVVSKNSRAGYYLATDQLLSGIQSGASFIVGKNKTLTENARGFQDFAYINSIDTIEYVAFDANTQMYSPTNAYYGAWAGYLSRSVFDPTSTTGMMNNIFGFRSFQTPKSGKVGNVYEYYAGELGYTGRPPDSVGNHYAFYSEPFNKTYKSTKNWGVYINGTQPNYFGGNVGIGTTAPVAAYLTTPGSTTNSSAVFGALELQSHAVGTQTIGSNLYYNGTTYKYRATNAGISSMIQINANGLLWHTAPAGSAGATATTTFRFGVDASGNGTFGGSITAKDTLKIGAARLYVPTGTLFESKGGVSTLTGLYVFDAARTTGLSITKIGTTSVVNANATDLTLDNIGIFKVKTFVTPSSYDRLTIDNAGVATFTNQVVTPVIAISSTDTASGTYPVGSMMLHIAAGDTSAWIKIRMTGSLTARWKKLTP